jgi:TRAP-type C4-dicarboxylate transport system permease small subunit
MFHCLGADALRSRLKEEAVETALLIFSVAVAIACFAGGVFVLWRGFKIEARTGSMIEAAPEIWAGACLVLGSLMPAFVAVNLLTFPR